MVPAEVVFLLEVEVPPEMEIFPEAMLPARVVVPSELLIPPETVVEVVDPEMVFSRKAVAFP